MKCFLFVILIWGALNPAYAEKINRDKMITAIVDNDVQYHSQNQRKEKFFRAETSNFKAYLGFTRRSEKGFLGDAVLYTSFGIPEYKVQKKGDYWFRGGCRSRSCPEKGFFWIDTKKKVTFFALFHYYLNEESAMSLDVPMLLLGSKQHKCND